MKTFSSAQKLIDRLSIARNLKEATSLVTKSMKDAGYPERIQDAYDNIEYNECALALEALCENLYDISCPVPQRAYELFEKTGITMGVDRKYWERLQSLIISQTNEELK